MGKEHEPVEGGFICPFEGCNASRQTPLGMSRHRQTHRQAETGGENE